MRQGTAALVLALLSAAPALAQQATDRLRDDLPETGTHAAEYVVIERDPKLDDFNQRVGAATAANEAWFSEYAQAHRGQRPLPYHPNFGVARDEYEHYTKPINHFRELSRSGIRLRSRTSGSTVTLELEGDDLPFDRLIVDLDAPAVTTSTGRTSFRSVVADLERASLPPAIHEGILFNTPDDVIRATRVRESVMIGRLSGTSTGIIHYSRHTADGPIRAFISYSLDD